MNGQGSERIGKNRTCQGTLHKPQWMANKTSPTYCTHLKNSQFCSFKPLQKLFAPKRMIDLVSKLNLKVLQIPNFRNRLPQD